MYNTEPLSIRDLSFFFMCSSLISAITLGWSIRFYIDSLMYPELIITLIIVCIMGYTFRYFYRIAFAIGGKK